LAADRIQVVSARDGGDAPPIGAEPRVALNLFAQEIADIFEGVSEEREDEHLTLRLLVKEIRGLLLRLRGNLLELLDQCPDSLDKPERSTPFSLSARAAV
jgi:hypothetical protein